MVTIKRVEIQADNKLSEILVPILQKYILFKKSDELKKNLFLFYV